MKRFTITQLLLFVTWCAIAFVAAARYLAAPPYHGHTHDVDGTTFVDYGLDAITETTIDEQAVVH